MMFRCIHSHGLQFICRWIMWARGTCVRRTGPANTWANNSILGSTLLQIHGEMNIPSQRMLFSVAVHWADELGLYNLSDLHFITSRVGDRFGEDIRKLYGRLSYEIFHDLFGVNLLDCKSLTLLSHLCCPF